MSLLCSLNCSLHHVIKFSRGQIIPVPSSVSELFITIFNNRWGEIEKAKESWIEFQLHVLHLIGALCSSCKVCCMKVKWLAFYSSVCVHAW